MAEPEGPQLYLITPAAPEAGFADRLAAVLDTRAVACVRLALAAREEGAITATADALREVCHGRDVALVIAEHVMLAERLGLDGVHLDGPRGVRAARNALGADAIVGAFCGTSRHDGMNAGEAGADYVAFGPVEAGALGDGTVAERDLFAWWSEMIELPVVAEGGMTAETLAALAPIADFIAVGPEIWGADDPVVALDALSGGLWR